MKEKLRKYIFQLGFLQIACLIIGYVIFRMAFPSYYFQLYPYMSVFFFALGTVTIFSILNATNRENRKYFNVFMITRMIKLFSCLVVVLLYAAFGENVISFLITFLVYFLIYSVFEAYVSTKLNKEKNETPTAKS